MRCLSGQVEPGTLRGIRKGLSSGAVVAAMVMLTLAAILMVMALPRMPQDPGYHRFADQRSVLGVPNVLNVISNLAFLAAGTFGVRQLLRHGASGHAALFASRHERWPLLCFYLGVILTGFGSAYYHFSPANAQLVWDRLPMTSIFMSFLAAVITERINARAGLLLLGPLLISGAATVNYWAITEQSGRGDLRPYAFVHYYPILLILLILWLFPSKYARDRGVLGVFALFALATLCEALDHPIFSMGGLVSGHTLKHLFAALAICWHTRMVLMRQPLNHYANTKGTKLQRQPVGRGG